MRLTISKYYLPSGKSISEVGVAPDIFVEESNEDFEISSDKDNQLNLRNKFVSIVMVNKNDLPMRIELSNNS